MIERGPATIDDMILAFVRAELDSERFGICYRKALARLAASRGYLIDDPDLNDVE